MGVFLREGSRSNILHGGYQQFGFYVSFLGLGD